LNKPYELGNKVSVAVSGKGNFVVAIKSFHGNPYDAKNYKKMLKRRSAIEPSLGI
jgi:hypothetical protein